MSAVLILAWALTFGWLPEQDAIISNESSTMVWEQDGPKFMADMSVRATILGHAVVYGNVTTYMAGGAKLSFAPYRADYVVGMELYGGGFSVGIRHECDHPIGSLWSVADGAYFLGAYGADTTLVYVRIGGTIK